MFARSIPGFLPSVKSVYTMTPLQLRVACRLAAKERLVSSKYWDALWYRTSVLAPKLTVQDISIIIDSMRLFSKYKSPMLVQHLLPIVYASPPSPDVTMIIRNVRNLLNNPNEQKVNFSALIAAANSLFELERIPPSSNIAALLAKRVNQVWPAVFSPKIPPKIYVNLLARLDTRSDDEDEPFYTTDVQEARKRLTDACRQMLDRFTPKDIVVFATVSSNDITDALLERNILHFKPADITTLILALGPKPLLISEFLYKIRDFRPKNCVKIWHHLRNFATPEFVEIVAARLEKYDTNTTLANTPELGQLIDLATKTGQRNLLKIHAKK